MKAKTKQGNQTHWSKVENLEMHKKHKETEWNSLGWRGEYPRDYVLNNKIRRLTCNNKVDNPLLEGRQWNWCEKSQMYNKDYGTLMPSFWRKN